jgi:hypothetical protein
MQLAREDGDLIAQICSLAYAVRDRELEIESDVGDVWNRLAELAESKRLDGEPKRLAKAMLRGRPLVGARLEDEWNCYAFVFRAELPVFRELLVRACGDDGPFEWLDRVSARRLDVFVAIG